MEQRSENFGFVIKSYIESLRPKTAVLNSSVPMSIQGSCPACETALDILCTLVGLEDNQKIRVGFCNHCGYVGYIDRPTAKWLTNFYKSQSDDLSGVDSGTFEHAYYPREFVEARAKFQSEGEHSVFSMPNIESEHSALFLLGLSHLHYFTKESLEILLNRYGYQIVSDSSPDAGTIVINACKVANPQPIMKFKTNYRALLIDRIRKGLALERLTDQNDHYYSWKEGWSISDMGDMTPLHRSGYIETLRWHIGRLMERTSDWAAMIFPFLRRFKKGKLAGIRIVEKIVGVGHPKHDYMMIVSSITNRVSLPGDSLFELQFPKYINLLIK